MERLYQQWRIFKTEKWEYRERTTEETKAIVNWINYKYVREWIYTNEQYEEARKQWLIDKINNKDRLLEEARSYWFPIAEYVSIHKLIWIIDWYKNSKQVEKKVEVKETKQEIQQDNTVLLQEVKEETNQASKIRTLLKEKWVKFYIWSSISKLEEIAKENWIDF